MNSNKTIKLLLSCPGDVQEELTIFENCIKDFNSLIGDLLQISIVSKHWKTDTHPDSGGEPQSKINEQLIDECFGAVAVFKDRFGTPTENYQSGTEEEIELMIEQDKTVMMYFSNYHEDDADGSQLKLIEEYKEKNKHRLYYFTYNNTEDFRYLLFKNLIQWLKNVYKNELLANDLHILSLNNKNKVVNNIDLYSITEYFNNNKNKTRQKIIDLLNICKKIKLKQASTINTFTLSIGEKVELEDYKKETIKNIAECFDITLDDDFFDLGNLHWSIGSVYSSSVGAFPGNVLDGTDDEIKKYNTITGIYNSIKDSLLWDACEKKFNGIKVYKLVLENKNKIPAFDVQVDLVFNEKSYIDFDFIDALGDDIKDFILSKNIIPDIFYIAESKDCLEYSASQVDNEAFTPSTYTLLCYDISVKEEYFNNYRIINQDHKTILRLNFPKIVQNTKICFPSILLTKDSDLKIEYILNSSSIDAPLSGTISAA